MARINYDDIIKTILKNSFVYEQVAKHNLSKKQMQEALPILIDMANQDIENSKYIISFYIASNGSVKRQEILSPKGVKESYMTRVLSQDFSPINFELEKDYFKNQGRAEAVKEFMPYLSDKYPTKGLYMYGKMGIGKTFLAKRFAKKLAELGKEIAFVNLSSLSSKLKSAFSTSSDKISYIIGLLKHVEFLFIDDIGAEQITEWFRDDILFSVLNFRMEHQKITFFTSNYPIEELEKIQAKTAKEKYRDFNKAKRLIERIKALAKPVLIFGENLRYK